MEFTINSLRRTFALLTCVAVFAVPAAAEEEATDTLVTTAVKVDTNEASRELAEVANATAAEDAAEAVLSATQLDLDIRLVGPTSVTIAAGR